MQFFVKVTGLSETEFSKKLNLSQSFVNQVINGTRGVGDETKRKISDYFGIAVYSVDDLLTVDDEREFYIKLINAQLKFFTNEKLEALANFLRFGNK